MLPLTAEGRLVGGLEKTMAEVFAPGAAKQSDSGEQGDAPEPAPAETARPKVSRGRLSTIVEEPEPEENTVRNAPSAPSAPYAPYGADGQAVVAQPPSPVGSRSDFAGAVRAGNERRRAGVATLEPRPSDVTGRVLGAVSAGVAAPGGGPTETADRDSEFRDAPRTLAGAPQVASPQWLPAFARYLQPLFAFPAAGTRQAEATAAHQDKGAPEAVRVLAAALTEPPVRASTGPRPSGGEAKGAGHWAWPSWKRFVTGPVPGRETRDRSPGPQARSAAGEAPAAVKRLPDGVRTRRGQL